MPQLGVHSPRPDGADVVPSLKAADSENARASVISMEAKTARSSRSVAHSVASVATTMRHIKQLQEKCHETPGPGAYSPQVVEAHTPAATIGRSSDHSQAGPPLPGPADYCTPLSVIKPPGPAFSIPKAPCAGMLDLATKARIPGPGQYQPLKTLPHIPSYHMGVPSRPKPPPLEGPGPGAHLAEIALDRLLKRSPSYKMGPKMASPSGSPQSSPYRRHLQPLHHSPTSASSGKGLTPASPTRNGVALEPLSPKSPLNPLKVLART